MRIEGKRGPEADNQWLDQERVGDALAIDELEKEKFQEFYEQALIELIAAAEGAYIQEQEDAGVTEGFDSVIPTDREAELMQSLGSIIVPFGDDVTGEYIVARLFNEGDLDIRIHKGSLDDMRNAAYEGKFPYHDREAVAEMCNIPDNSGKHATALKRFWREMDRQAATLEAGQDTVTVDGILYTARKFEDKEQVMLHENSVPILCQSLDVPPIKAEHHLTLAEVKEQLPEANGQVDAIWNALEVIVKDLESRGLDKYVPPTLNGEPIVFGNVIDGDGQSHYVLDATELGRIQEAVTAREQDWISLQDLKQKNGLADYEIKNNDKYGTIAFKRVVNRLGNQLLERIDDGSLPRNPDFHLPNDRVVTITPEDVRIEKVGNKYTLLLKEDDALLELLRTAYRAERISALQNDFTADNPEHRVPKVLKKHIDALNACRDAALVGAELEDAESKFETTFQHHHQQRQRSESQDLPIPQLTASELLAGEKINFDTRSMLGMQYEQAVGAEVRL